MNHDAEIKEIEARANASHAGALIGARTDILKLITWLREAYGRVKVLEATIEEFCPALKTGDKAWEISDLVVENKRLEEKLKVAVESAEGGSIWLHSLLLDLEMAEEKYRKVHDLHGGDSILAGRAWDRMRGCGDRAREALAKIRGAK